MYNSQILFSSMTLNKTSLLDSRFLYTTAYSSCHLEIQSCPHDVQNQPLILPPKA